MYGGEGGGRVQFPENALSNTWVALVFFIPCMLLG